jgi:3-keto-L-gulonate-6-phosphate decarboxylase
MINVEEPLRVLMKARATPDVVVLHRGRDEENTRGKVIQYKQIKRIRSKFDTLISAAGGVDLKEAQSASFNGANIVVVNIVHPSDPWTGIDSDAEITEIANRFLKTIQ